MLAKYETECPSCWGRIKVDDEIIPYNEDTWMHEECPEVIDASTLGRNERLCADCFTIHAGEECP